jgi:hypothetical protein
MTDLPRRSPPGVLRAADVAELWTIERRKTNPDAPAYKQTTPLVYLRESQKTLVNGRPRRYASVPMPAPAGRMGLTPWWHKDQTEALLAWWRNRPGYGHGRGGWPAGRPRPARPAERAGPTTTEPDEAELLALADEIDQVVGQVADRLSGGELERRRKTIEDRVRRRQSES